MRSGAMRHVITVEAQTKSQDSTGSILSTWSEFAVVRASIEPVAGREFFAASQVQSDVTSRIRIRFLGGITEKMRVLHGSDYYDIQAVLRDSNSGRHEMQLMCVKRGSKGFRDG